MSIRILTAAALVAAVSACSMLDPDPNSPAYQWGYAQGMKINAYCQTLAPNGSPKFLDCQRAMDAEIPPYPGSQQAVWILPTYPLPANPKPVVCTPGATAGSIICQ